MLPPLREHGAERVLEPEAVPGALADLDVGQQPEQGAAPIGPTPGVRPIETLVASPRQALRETAHEVTPHLLRAQLAGPRASLLPPSRAGMPAVRAPARRAGRAARGKAAGSPRPWHRFEVVHG